VTFEELNPPYATIVADPPWPYENANKSAAAISHTIKRDGTVARGVNNLGYSTLSIEELCAMPVAGLAAPNAHLYLWVTNTFMEEGHRICRAWGFTPKTILTWVKTHQDDPTRVSMKTGYYFRGATEHAIFAVRGSLPLAVDEGIPTAHLWPRIGAHSVKPEAFMDLVEKVSPGPYLELFSRRTRFFWDTWGYGYEGVA
jgi:N6-adenosine-specific RNA methylase IME4